MTPVVMPYDPRWPDHFAAESAALRSALGQWLLAGVHHVGSTSIPGMPAKPIIDMIAGVRNLADASLAEPALQRLGYTRAVHRTDTVLFNKASGESHTHHLHLTVPGSELWRERLAFRDILRRDPSLISEYTQLKAQLLEHTGGRPYGGVGKRDFVRRVLASAGIDLKDGLHADRRQNRRRADAWVMAGGAVARAEDANVELDEVERFYTERDLRNQIA